MKKVFASIVIAGIVFACSRKTIPQSEIIISNQEKKVDTTEIVATNTNETNAGKSVYTTRCGRCHALKPVENYTVQQWENILKSMRPKAGLNETDSKQVTVYVMEHAKK